MNEIKIKKIANIVGRIGFRGYTTEDIVAEGEGAIAISPTNIVDNSFTIEKKNTFISWDKYYESPDIFINPEDIVFVKTASVGKVAIIPQNVKYKLTLNPQLVVFKKIKQMKKFFYYVLSSTLIKEQLKNELIDGVIPNISQTKILNFNIPNPPLPQQTAIANYLDHHTTKIDKEISLLEQKVEKLDEYKQALIYETVTKGLNKNVPMKDSEIKWIGMIPEYWKVRRVKDFYKLGMGETILKEDLIENGKYPIYSATAEDKFFGYLNDLNLILKKDDLVIPARGNSIGHVKLVKQPLGCTQTTIYLKKKKKINSSYIYYYLIGNKSELFFFDDTAIPQITVAQINGKMILLPPKNEQQNIAKYLDEQCSKIDNKKELINKKVELLKEYKQSLIYEAVTGKIIIDDVYVSENNISEEIYSDIQSFLSYFQKSFTPSYEIKNKEDLAKIKKELQEKKYGTKN